MSYIATYSRNKVQFRQRDKFEDIVQGSPAIPKSSPDFAAKLDILKSKLQTLRNVVDKGEQEGHENHKGQGVASPEEQEYSADASTGISEETTGTEYETDNITATTTSATLMSGDKGNSNRNDDSIELVRDVPCPEYNDFLSLSFEEVFEGQNENLLVAKKCTSGFLANNHAVRTGRDGKIKRQPSNSTLLDSSKALPVHKVWQQDISPISQVKKDVPQPENTPAQTTIVQHDGRAPRKKKKLWVSWAVEDLEDDSEKSTTVTTSTQSQREELSKKNSTASNSKVTQARRPTSTPNQSKVGRPHFSAVMSPVKNNSSVFGMHQTRSVDSQEIHVSLPSDIEENYISPGHQDIQTTAKESEGSSSEPKKFTSTPYNGQEVQLQFSTNLSSVLSKLTDKAHGDNSEGPATSASRRSLGGKGADKSLSKATGTRQKGDNQETTPSEQTENQSTSSVMTKLRKLTSTPYEKRMTLLQFSANISSVHDVCAENDFREECGGDTMVECNSQTTHNQKPKNHQDTLTKYTTRHSTAHHICSEIHKAVSPTDNKQDKDDDSSIEERNPFVNDISMAAPVMAPEPELTHVEVPPIPDVISDEDAHTVPCKETSKLVTRTTKHKTTGQTRRKSLQSKQIRYRKSATTSDRGSDWKELPVCPIESLSHLQTKQKPSRIWLKINPKKYKYCQKYSSNIPLDPFFH